MKRLTIFFSLAMLCSCGQFGNEEKNKEGERTVCIAKQYTEIIFALGAEENLVAVDVSSTYPPAAKKLPTVGYHRALSTEGILSAKPTLILHDNNIGPEQVVKQLTDLDIPMKTFVHGETLDSAKMLIKEVGAYFHKAHEADSLCAMLDADMDRALEQAKNYKDTPRVLIIHYGQASNVYLVMTQKSTGAKMVQWAGGKMAIEGEKGMKPLSAEIVAASDPDVILLTDYGYDKLGSQQKILELPGIAGTRAAKNNRIYRVEEHDMVYIGPRTGANVLQLQQLIHQP